MAKLTFPNKVKVPHPFRKGDIVCPASSITGPFYLITRVPSSGSKYSDVVGLDTGNYLPNCDLTTHVLFDGQVTLENHDA